MEIRRTVVVFDAADLPAESAFWAGMLGGRVVNEDTWHSVIDSEGRWVVGHPFCIGWRQPDDEAIRRHRLGG
jgi:hypothetical protein